MFLVIDIFCQIWLWFEIFKSLEIYDFFTMNLIVIYRKRAQRPPSNLMSRTNSSVNVDIQTIKQRKEATVNKGCTEGITSYISKYRRNIFWLTLYTLVSFGIFIERAYCKYIFLYLNL